MDGARSAETELKRILFTIAEWRERPENLDDDCPRELEGSPTQKPLGRLQEEIEKVEYF